MDADDVYDEMRHNVRELEELGVEFNDRISRMVKRMSYGIDEMKTRKADLESDIKRLEAHVTELKREESTLERHIKRQRAVSTSPPSPKRRKITGESHKATGSQSGPPSSPETQNLTGNSSDATKALRRLPRPPSPNISVFSDATRPPSSSKERKVTSNSDITRPPPAHGRKIDSKAASVSSDPGSSNCSAAEVEERDHSITTAEKSGQAFEKWWNWLRKPPPSSASDLYEAKVWAEYNYQRAALYSEFHLGIVFENGEEIWHMPGLFDALDNIFRESFPLDPMYEAQVLAYHKWKQLPEQVTSRPYCLYTLCYAPSQDAQLEEGEMCPMWLNLNKRSSHRY